MPLNCVVLDLIPIIKMHRDFNKQNSWQIIEKWKHDKARVRDKKCAQIECYLLKGIIFDTTWKRRKGKKRENTTWFRITQITTLNNRCHIAVFVENNKSPPKKSIMHTFHHEDHSIQAMYPFIIIMIVVLAIVVCFFAIIYSIVKCIHKSLRYRYRFVSCM